MGGLLDAVHAVGGSDQAWVDGLARALAPLDVGAGHGAWLVNPWRHPDRLSAGSWRDEAREPALQFLNDAAYERLHASGRCWFHPGRLVAATPLAEAAGYSAQLRATPCWTAVGSGGGGVHVALSIGVVRKDQLSRDSREVLDVLGAHLGAALRLRALVARAPESEPLAATDALRRDAAVRSRRPGTPEGQVLWRAVGSGLWSIVTASDEGGLRRLVALRNGPGATALLRLTPLEWRVARQAAYGHAYKVVGAELGLSASRVARVLQLALLKLGLRSRAELILLLGPGSVSTRPDAPAAPP